MTALTEKEIASILRAKSSYRASPLDCRRWKLKTRFRGRYEEELRRTLEKAEILRNLIQREDIAA